MSNTPRQGGFPWRLVAIACIVVMVMSLERWWG